MDPTQPRPPSASAVETTHLVLPPDTNALGSTFGGRIMQWMDIAAGIAASRHCGHTAVTAAVDDLHFARPMRLGDVVVIKARVNHAGTTSMEVGVRVEREIISTNTREHCLTGYFLFVAVDDDGITQRVPPIEPDSDDDKRRFENAIRRRHRRLSARKARQTP
jgi:acyl-CoA hydrolase